MSRCFPRRARPARTPIMTVAVILAAAAVVTLATGPVVTVAASAVAAGASAAAKRPRIVSINPCADALLMRLADPEQIAGISHYSHDPAATSIPLEVARRFKTTSGTAEEVVALAPNVVMSGPHVAPSTIFALERMRIRVLKFSVPESIEESEQQIREVAAAVGSPERADALIDSIRDAVAAARPPSEPQHRVSAVIWQSGGMVPGPGTLADQLLRLTGYENVSAAYGLQKWDILPLELLIASPPALVLSGSTYRADRDRMLGHPALRHLSNRVTFRNYPFRLLQCGGPTIIEAVGRLSEVRRQMSGAL